VTAGHHGNRGAEARESPPQSCASPPPGRRPSDRPAVRTVDEDPR
jgi:hypothetical protein